MFKTNGRKNGSNCRNKIGMPQDWSLQYSLWQDRAQKQTMDAKKCTDVDAKDRRKKK